MKKRVHEKYADLKVGDTVVRHMENSNREKPTEFKITKIGKKYIHIDAPFYEKYNRERGYGEFGYYIFPGTLAEYLAWKETQERAREISHRLTSTIYQLTSKELDIIESVMNGTYEPQTDIS